MILNYKRVKDKYVLEVSSTLSVHYTIVRQFFFFLMKQEKQAKGVNKTENRQTVQNDEKYLPKVYSFLIFLRKNWKGC